MADGGVDLGRDRGARTVGAFPGRDLKWAESRCAESGCFPGREYHIIKYHRRCVVDQDPISVTHVWWEDGTKHRR